MADQSDFFDKTKADARALMRGERIDTPKGTKTTNERVKTIIKPAIQLDDLTFTDMNNSERTGDNRGSRYDQYMGYRFPMILVNGYIFTHEELMTCSIDCSGFYPTFNMTAYVSDSAFTASSQPLDGSLASTYIRSGSNVIKPLRIDFEITSARFQPMQRTAMDRGHLVSISGKMRVPKSRSSVCLAIETKTSYDALLEIANTVGLGFASNETQTNDKMTWVCPNASYEEFIEYIGKHAWKDENSFFHAFVDPYYILNFVNVNTLIKDDETPVEAMVTTDIIRGHYSAVNEKQEETSAPLYLSNLPHMATTNMFIIKHEVVNNSLGVAASRGYKQYHHFYEKKTKEHYALLIDPIQSDGAAQQKIVLRGRVNEDFYKDEAKHIWMGVQYTMDNTHDNFGFAKNHSERNYAEMNKMTLRVTLDRPNLNITKFSRIPVYIFIRDNAGQYHANQTDEERNADVGITYDKFLSGWYVVTGMRFIYQPSVEVDSSTIHHELTLSRREWPTPARPPDTVG